MDVQTPMNDRRLFKRYSIDKPVLITGDRLVGLIKDLSCGGCSFRYLKKRQDIDSLSGAHYWLYLDPLGMSKVRVQTVEDLPEHSAAGNMAGSMHLRRVRFTDLNHLQLQSLMEFFSSNCWTADEENLVLPKSGPVQINKPKATLLGISPSC